ncbi:hypothetical protein [Deinococcus sp. QL22]|uniref:hypothetical protein n=1 Tax=Deinococcus sp. QL22 TaxID=2939437 RepID=UPI0020173BE4|nr:hypothetical protein [Deinococcus sp. QL22]UQN05466.1 hypothetical protein M1R55_11330 [Deinococcus sp. QL22]
MTLAPVSAGGVASLLPGATAPSQAHVNLAGVWLRGELARRQIDPDTLTGDRALAARTAWAAKALAYRAALDSTSGSQQAGSEAAALELASLKVPGEIELTYRAGMSSSDLLRAAAADWAVLAAEFLALVTAGHVTVRRFPGASR